MKTGRAILNCKVDYTLKRKGDKIFYIVDELGHPLNFGMWRTKKAAIEAFIRNPWKVEGYTLCGFAVEHVNYSHWADFEKVNVPVSWKYGVIYNNESED